MAQSSHNTRRALFVGVAVLPLALSSAALAAPDAELVQACNTALGAWAEMDGRGMAENWSDERVGVNVDIVLNATERASNLPASTNAGLQAKARLLARHYAPDFEDQEPDAAGRLLVSLLQDLTGQGGRA
jgi:hypothetical protein